MRCLYIKSILPMLLLCFAFTLLFSLYSSVFADPPGAQQISEGWEYRFGDSPVNSDGVFDWLNSDKDSNDWKPFTYPGQPPNPENNSNVWLRVKLPNIDYRDACIFLMTNDQIFEVYMGKKLVYSFGDMEHKRNIAPGSPWHMIELPDGYEGSTIYIRMHTVFPFNAGLLRTVSIGERADHITNVIKGNTNILVLSIIFVFIGLILIFIYLLRKNLPVAFLSLGFFAICFGAWLISETNIKQIFLDSPRFWLYAAISSFYMMPVGFLLFVENLFMQSKWSSIAILRRLFILFIVLVLSLDIMEISPVVYSLKYYYILLVSSIIASAVIIGKSAIKGNKEARVFSLGFAMLSVFGIYDIFGWYLRVVPWSHFVVSYGMLVFIFTLVYILAQRVVNVYDQLKIYSNDIATANATLSQMYNEVNESRDKLTHWNKTLEQKVALRTASIRNLLNNAGQGFLTFGADLVVDDNYSYECIKIFKGEIINRSFPDLIYANNREQHRFFQSLLIRILEEKNMKEREKYLPLLPEEVIINEKYIHIDYKIISNNVDSEVEIFMIILTDITDKRYLESQMEQERNILKMVVKVIANYNDFIDVVNDYQSFCKRRLANILKSNRSPDDVYFELFRSIHTYKGSFGQFDMKTIYDSLHDLESEIAAVKSEYEELSLERLKELVCSFDLTVGLNEDLEVLKNILGEQFLRQENTLTIDKSKLLEIEKKMLAILSPYEYKLLLPDIQRLRYKPFREILKGFPDYIEKLAERQNKLIAPIEISGGDILVDLDKYNGFSKSLVHVFRNIIDHGIEATEERAQLGKSEYGNIACKIEIQGNSICLSISDDGHGISINTIKRRAIEEGIYDEPSISRLTDDEVVDLIFKDQFSTKNTISDLSGRGFGLAAVKSQVERIGGKIKVISKINEGTEFVFIFPFEESHQLPEITASSIINPIIDTVKTFLMEQINTPIKYLNYININKTDNILLKEYTAIINIKGILNGRFVITMDEKLTRSIAQSFILGELSEEEEIVYMEDVLAECSNIIIGNSIKMFPELENMVIIEPPITLNIKDASIRFMEATTWVCTIECDFGAMDLSFVALDAASLM